MNSYKKMQTIINSYGKKVSQRPSKKQLSLQYVNYRNLERQQSLKKLHDNFKRDILLHKSLNKIEPKLQNKKYTISNHDNPMIKKNTKKQKQSLIELKNSWQKSDCIKIKSKIEKQNKRIFKYDNNNFIEKDIHNLDVSYQEIKKLEAFYRYYPISLITFCNQKSQFINQYILRTVKVINLNNYKISFKDNIQKLKRNAKLKGKYRYRQRFNPQIIQQIKCLNYKFMKKQIKNKKKETSSEQSSDDQDKIQLKKQKIIKQLTLFKKQLAQLNHPKIFIIKGNYKDLRQQLISRGWIQNPDKNSTFYDLKWTVKISDIQFDQLHNDQLVNHFHNTPCLTSKYGLCKTLRSIIYSQNVDTDKFFPKCFDLGDMSDFQNFLENYKWTFAQSILKQYVQNPSKYEQQTYKIKISIQILQRRMANLTQIISQIKNKLFAVCTPQQWSLLYEDNIQKSKILKAVKQKDDYQEDLLLRSKQILKKLKQKDPQYYLNGHRNIWILKPNYLSRGRGIKCLVKLNQILDYTLGKDNFFVAQKYIENPLLIMNRKFDIRQWVLVQDYNPAKIWFYDQFYLRFCAQQYNIENIGNKFMHLTNNSIQKHSKQFKNSEIQGNMWSMQQFKQYLKTINQSQVILKNIIKKIKDIVILSIKSTEDQVTQRKNSFQLFGYDFMIDSNFNPWLIQINTSPAMDYSTRVTKRLVKMVMSDTVKVIIDSRFQKKNIKNQTGLFKCIYKGKQIKKNRFPID